MRVIGSIYFGMGRSNTSVTESVLSGVFEVSACTTCVYSLQTTGVADGTATLYERRLAIE